MTMTGILPSMKTMSYSMPLSSAISMADRPFSARSTLMSDFLSSFVNILRFDSESVI